MAIDEQRPAPSAGEPYELELGVEAADIDALGHVNNVVYVRWVQEAAVAHWLSLTTTAQQADLAWVVLRHEIDYKRPARLGDEVIARTWVGPATRTTFERHTEILQMPGRSLLARARTLWCPVDPHTGRLKPVSAAVRALVSTRAARARQQEAD